MDFHKQALLLGLVESLKRQSLPADRMRVHNALFLLQETISVDVSFDFIYNNGPCSPEADTELQRMKTYDAITAQPVLGVGMVFQPGHNAGWLEHKYSLDDRERSAIDFICDFIASTALSDGEHDPIKLDRLATILWILQRLRVQEAAAVIKRLDTLKPQVPAVAVVVAQQEVRLVDELIQKAGEYKDGKARRATPAE